LKKMPAARSTSSGRHMGGSERRTAIRLESCRLTDGTQLVHEWKAARATARR
jgi:hypothetical protein